MTIRNVSLGVCAVVALVAAAAIVVVALDEIVDSERQSFGHGPRR